MSYPDIAQSWDSSRKPVKGTKIDMAENGTVRGRNFHTQTVYNFKINHELVTSAEMQSVIDCYASVQSSTLNMTWKGNDVIYSVIFIVEPTIQPAYDGLYNVVSELIGTTA